MKAFIGLLFLTAAFTMGGVANAQTKWDMPTPYPATNFHTENISQFVADVDQATSGKLKITLHANGSLFKGNEIKRAVQGGQAQIGELLLSSLENEDPIYGVDTIPFLATSYTDAMKLWKVSRKATEERFTKQGLKILYAVAWPPQGIYSVKPVNSATDLKGSKWRAYNPGTSRIATLVGAQPVTIQASELAQAAATGAVESLITSGATGVDSKLYEHMKFFYDTQAWLPKNIVFASQKAFDALDKTSQEAVLKAAADAEARGWKVSEEKTRSYLETLARNGMKVETPSAQLKADMKKVGETITSEWLGKAGADGKMIVDAFGK